MLQQQQSCALDMAQPCLPPPPFEQRTDASMPISQSACKTGSPPTQQDTLVSSQITTEDQFYSPLLSKPVRVTRQSP